MKFKKMMGLGLIISLLTLTGCGYEPKLLDGKELVAEIEGTQITVDSLYEQIKDRFARDILIEMIDNSILAKKYEVDEEMQRTVDGEMEYIKMQTGNEFLQAIKYYYGANSEAEFKAMLITEQQKKLAAEDYAKTIITDKEINNYYKEEITGDIKVSHILIKPTVTDDMEEEEIETKETEALNLAKEIITKLNNGEKFTELAKEYSDDKTNSDNGGDLGYFNKGKMALEFEKAAYALEKDKYTTTPIKTSYGYHIILKVDQKDKPSLDMVKSNILETLVEEKLNTESTLRIKAMYELRKANGLEIYDTELKKQYDSYMNELLK